VLDGTDTAGCDGAAVAAEGMKTGSTSGASDRGAGAAAVGMLAGGKDVDARAPIAGMEEEETSAVEAAEADTGGDGGAPASVVAAGAAAAAAVVSTAACKEAESASAAEMAAAAVLAGNLLRLTATAAEELDPDLRSAVGSALMPGCALGG